MILNSVLARQCPENGSTSFKRHFLEKLLGAMQYFKQKIMKIHFIQVLLKKTNITDNAVRPK